MRYLKPYLLLFAVIIACSRQDGQEVATFDTYTVNGTAVFLSTETSDFIGSPTRIKAYKGGIYVSDDAFKRIYKIDKEGHKLLSFGKHGRGPGEFDLPTGFWIFDDVYLVYDYNGFKFITYDTLGNLISERVIKANPVNPDGFPPNIPLTTHAISPYELLIPSRGRNGSLFAIANIETGKLRFLGKAIGKHVESYNYEEVQQAFSNGEIPDIFLNSVVLGSSSSGIYSFQQTTGKLDKYSYSGDLLWEKNLKIPAQNDLFDQIVRKNQERDKNNEPPHLFNYAKAVDAHENGIAVLLNMPEEYPVTVAWVSNDGIRMDVVTYRGLDQEKLGYLSSFSVSPSDKRAYFLNSQDGIIFEAEWPL